MNQVEGKQESRRQRWLHPRHLSYVGVTIVSLLFLPPVALGLILLFIAIEVGRWYSKYKARS